MKRTAALLIASVFVSLSAHAASCKAPNAPDLTVNGAKLSIDDFNTLTQGLVAFDGSLSKYRSCLDGILNNPDDNTAQEWRAALDAYNQISRTQAGVYDRYDIVSRDFQATQKARAVAAAEQESSASVKAAEKQLAETATKHKDS